MPRPRDLPAEFLGSFPTEVPPTGLPEIALAGRSNVGKSSLINRLMRNRKLARVSKTPGRTRAVNLFRVGKAFCLVDLPGYGYAKASHDDRASWKKMVEGYVFDREELGLVIHLVDSRIEPQPADRMLRDSLGQYDIPMCVVATKIDGVPRAQRARRLADIRKALELGPDEPIAVSAETGEGLDKLWDVLEGAG